MRCCQLVGLGDHDSPGTQAPAWDQRAKDQKAKWKRTQASHKTRQPPTKGPCRLERVKHRPKRAPKAAGRRARSPWKQGHAARLRPARPQGPALSTRMHAWQYCHRKLQNVHACMQPACHGSAGPSRFARALAAAASGCCCRRRRSPAFAMTHVQNALRQSRQRGAPHAPHPPVMQGAPWTLFLTPGSLCTGPGLARAGSGDISAADN